MGGSPAAPIGYCSSSRIRADESDIRLVATAATVAALLAGPGRQADVVLLDLGLGDGTTVDGNVAAILTAGPAVLVLSASDRKMGISEETAKQCLGRVREKYANAGRAAATKLELYYRAVEDGYLLPPP
jgi:DNA-binding NarL/FixJ family response regulator